ncbi:sugar transferase [uncultured Sphingomonas sp.]|uniref:sugar transferase n=1 Tax=uncultured Sphingomonas sp. TaxID=158754 RepID=UPI0035CB7D53
MTVGIQRSPWHRLRTQLSGCLLLGALLPYLLRVATLSTLEVIGPVQETSAGAVVAILFGVWLLRNVSPYPGVEAGGFILPAMSLSYAILLVVFLLARFDYSRITLLLGFLGSLAWLFFSHYRAQREQQLRIGLLPFGSANSRPEVAGVTWVSLGSPDIDVSGLNAVAADLRVDLPEAWERRLAEFALNGMPVLHIKHLFESLSGRVELEHLSENNFGSLAPVSAWMTLKHVIDWVAALVFGLLLLPALLVVALAVRLSSPGPVLFRQTRIGYRGKPFTVYKFRTMTVCAEPVDARSAAITRAADARVTRFGRFLRRSRIDELPQMINVLRGEMSWIGPRPEAEVLSRWYQSEIPFYLYRHIVRPGIAGWAQVVQGHVADVDEVRSKLHYDFYYIKNYSPWIDLLIVAKTIRTMLTGFGAR